MQQKPFILFKNLHDAEGQKMTDIRLIRRNRSGKILLRPFASVIRVEEVKWWETQNHTEIEPTKRWFLGLKTRVVTFSQALEVKLN